jgi:hypothetical protein
VEQSEPWRNNGRMKQRRFDSVLHAIVREMNKYYRSRIEAEVNLRTVKVYFVFGVVVALLALLLALFPPVSRI